jgi:hypothetical protein
MSWLIVGIAPLSIRSAALVVGPPFDRQSPPAGRLPILRVLEPTA